jgi:hypothetical protein
MSCGDWPVIGPFGLDAGKGETCGVQRTVLVAVHHLTAGTRLGDIVPLLESDRRVQVVYTWAPGSVFSRGVREYLSGLGGVVIPWCQARQVTFDLALAAAHGSLEQLHAPVLTLPHGVGFGKYTTRWDGPGPAAACDGAGAVRARLVYHGRVVPSAIVVSTTAHLAHLRRSCPEAAAAAVMAGDPSYDRLVVSLRARAAYRDALGTGERILVAVSSTWSPGSLLGEYPGLLPRLAAELPARDYQIAAILHSNIWAWHSRRQVLAWYAGCLQRNLVVVPPEEGWRAVLAAADVLVGDGGSVTTYAAAAGVPVLLASSPGTKIEPGSPPAAVARVARRLCWQEPLVPQLGRAMSAWAPADHAAIAAEVTDVPGQSARLIRQMMYRLMDLPEPGSVAKVTAVPVAGPGSSRLVRYP